MTFGDTAFTSDTVMQSYLRPRCLPFERTGEAMPPSPLSLGVNEKCTIITNIRNAVAHLQLEVCKSSRDLLPTNKNDHNYLQNHIKSIST